MFNLISKSEITIKDKPQKNRVLKPGKIKKLQYPGNVYSLAATQGYTIGTRGVFQQSEYDLGEVAKVIDIEAYVRQAFNKHAEQCLKEGYKIVSRNADATDYIRRRLHEIGEASSRTFDSLLRGIITNIVSFSNCFVVKKRDRETSSGMPRRGPEGEMVEPIAGYFILDPTSMQIKRNIHGTVKKYKQVLPGVGKYPLFSPIDIVHMFYDRKEGFAWGTPYIIPVLDDIRTLRRMEENVEMLTVAHLFPLFQYKVGTDDHPAEIYEDGTTEVDVIKEEIENMPTEGSIVTPERHEIKALGAEGKALDATKYLDHFEKRVLAGLGISEIALGRGGTANRNTAAVIDKGLQDRCKDFQDVIEGFVTEYLFKELLLEGGFKIDETEENMVKLVFNEIDLETQIKAENHSVFKYEHDIVTESETRELLGKDPITEEQRADMYFEHVTKPKAIIMAVDEPYTAEAKQGGAIAKVSKEEKKKKETVERNQPSNQHGRKMAKTKTKKDDLVGTGKLPYADEYVKIIDGLHGEARVEDIETEKTYNPVLIMKLKADIQHYWNITKDDILDYIRETYIEENRNFRDFTPEKLKMILFLTKDSMVKKSGIYVFKALGDGVKKAAKDTGHEGLSLSFDPKVKYQYLNERIEHYTTSLLSDLGAQLVKNINPDFSDIKELKEMRGRAISTVSGVFGALEYRLGFTAHTEIMKAYNFGYALAMRDLGYKELYIKLAENHCEKCKEASGEPLSLEYFSFEDVAPAHPMCNCTYTISKQ